MLLEPAGTILGKCMQDANIASATDPAHVGLEQGMQREVSPGDSAGSHCDSQGTHGAATAELHDMLLRQLHSFTSQNSDRAKKKDLFTVMSEAINGLTQQQSAARIAAALGWKARVPVYSICCFCIVGMSSAASVLLWSRMGCAPDCLEGLQRAQRYAPIPAGLLVILFTALYLLDYFCPPHLPGRHFVVQVCGFEAGRSAGAVLVVLAVVACYLQLNASATVPLALTIFLSPASIIAVRYATLPTRKSGMTRDLSDQVDTSVGVNMAIGMLQDLSVEEWDQMNFYCAATAAFSAAAVATLVIWVLWALHDEVGFGEETSGKTGGTDYNKIIEWIAPAIVSASNLAFACFAGLRVALNHSYNSTSELRSRLVGRKGQLGEKMMNLQMERLLHAVEAIESKGVGSAEMHKMAQDVRQQFLVQKVMQTRRLSSMVRTIGCGFTMLIGGAYVVFQITIAGRAIALAAQSFLIAFFATFAAFCFMSFNRVWNSMQDELKHLPLWRSLVAASHSDFACAAMLFFGLPLSPIVLLLSAVSQRVRRCRNITAHPRVFQWPTPSSARMDGEGNNPDFGVNPADVPSSAVFAGFFTARVEALLHHLSRRNRLNLLYRCYVVGTLAVVYQVTPTFLNVGLSWLRGYLEGAGFALIVCATYLMGIGLFMLPPVPGPPIYLFGGLVISDTCPWGYWWGTLVCIGVCVFLKLSACALQQKVIGERLSSNDYVRRTVGMHRPFMRAVRNVLAQPGLSFGKCMILCGGPDWPTSVLAGIMRLSLFQCLLGTLPVSLNLVPLVLVGSLYTKREEGAIYKRMGAFAFTLAILTSVSFWAGMGWAINNEFDKRHAELTRPRAEDLELDWADHCVQHTNKKCSVKWSEILPSMRLLISVGALSMTVCGHMHFWAKGMMYVEIAIEDDLTDFALADLITNTGRFGLLLLAMSFACLFAFRSWLRHATRDLATSARDELLEQEATWKEARLSAASLALRAGLGADADHASTAPEAAAQEEGSKRADHADGRRACGADQGRGAAQVAEGAELVQQESNPHTGSAGSAEVASEHLDVLSDGTVYL